jgi:hypothetical protein
MAWRVNPNPKQLGRLISIVVVIFRPTSTLSCGLIAQNVAPNAHTANIYNKEVNVYICGPPDRPSTYLNMLALHGAAQIRFLDRRRRR